MQRDFQPVWSPDGTELLYVGATSAGQLEAVPVSTTAGVVFGTPTRFPFILTAGRLSGMTRAFDVVPDGRFVGLIAGGADERATSPNSEIRIVLNWYEELKRLVPVK